MKKLKLATLRGDPIMLSGTVAGIVMLQEK